MQDPIDQVLSERDKTHGSFDSNASVSQSIKAAMRKHEKWRDLSLAQRESLEMIAHKIGRIVSGNPNFKDHWTDICGYSRLIEKMLEK